MIYSSQSSAERLGDTGTARTKAAAIWLCLVAATTGLNSFILFKYSRSVDLFIGLSFTQFIDAVFLGMQLEPPGAPWWYTAVTPWVLDMPFVVLLLVLAVKVSHRRRRAIQFAFWLYIVDTLVITLVFAVSIAILHSPFRPLARENLTLILHAVGVLILYRARQASLSAQIPN